MELITVHQLIILIKVLTSSFNHDRSFLVGLGGFDRYLSITATISSINPPLRLGFAYATRTTINDRIPTIFSLQTIVLLAINRVGGAYRR
jgi:hypothetical protein